MFRVGDIVECTKDGIYLITARGVLCKVVKVVDENTIIVKILKGNSIQAVYYQGKCFDVDASDFRLVEVI